MTKKAEEPTSGIKKVCSKKGGHYPLLSGEIPNLRRTAGRLGRRRKMGEDQKSALSDLVKRNESDGEEGHIDPARKELADLNALGGAWKKGQRKESGAGIIAEKEKRDWV